MTVLIVRTIQQQRCTEVLKVLLDSESNAALMHEPCLPMGAVPIKAPRFKRVQPQQLVAPLTCLVLLIPAACDCLSVPITVSLMEFKLDSSMLIANTT